MSKTPHSYNFGRRLDGTIATEQDWEQWREEFWRMEARALLYDLPDEALDSTNITKSST
jgi:hypothetical protein